MRIDTEFNELYILRCMHLDSCCLQWPKVPLCQWMTLVRTKSVQLLWRRWSWLPGITLHGSLWCKNMQKLIIEQLTWVYGRVMLRMDGKSPQHCAWWRSLDHKNCLQVVSKWVRAFLAIVSDPLQKKLFNQHSSQTNTFVALRTLCADTTGSPLYLQSQAEARIRIAKMTGDIRKWTCDRQIVHDSSHGVA